VDGDVSRRAIDQDVRLFIGSYHGCRNGFQNLYVHSSLQVQIVVGFSRKTLNIQIVDSEKTEMVLFTIRYKIEGLNFL